MKNIFTFGLLLFVTAYSASAQKIAKEKKYEKIIYNEITKEVGDLTVYVVDAFSTNEFFKFKLRIQNKSANYVMVDFTKMTISDKNGKINTPNEKPLMIAPGEFGVRVVNSLGPDFLTPTLKINLEGLSYASVNGKVFQAPIFKLPVSSNDFTAGPFKVYQKENVLKTDVAYVKFEVQYSGKEIGIVQPAKAVLKMPNGSDFAHMGNKKVIILAPGSNEIFALKWMNIDPKIYGDVHKDSNASFL